MTKLYELHRGDKYTINYNSSDALRVPPDAPFPDCTTMVYTLGAIDGMYSNSQGDDGERYYFAAWTEVNPIEK